MTGAGNTRDGNEDDAAREEKSRTGSLGAISNFFSGWGSNSKKSSSAISPMSPVERGWGRNSPFALPEVSEEQVAEVMREVEGPRWDEGRKRMRSSGGSANGNVKKARRRSWSREREGEGERYEMSGAL